jgi:hypothetical protein
MTLALPAGKQEGATVLLLHLLDDRHYRRGQWNAVFLASLHAPGRYRPNLAGDLGGQRADHLARARRRENQELERACGHAPPGRATRP